MNNKNTTGFSIVEVLLAMGIFAIFSIGIFYLSLDTVQRDIKISLNTEALLYAQEGMEAARNISDRNFLLLTNGDHGLDLNGGTWDFIPAPESLQAFYERTITIGDVYRNEAGDIDEEGIYYDPDTKKIISEVLWYQRGIIPRLITLNSYISNWKGDDWITTTCSEFDEGTFEDTETEILDSPPEDNCGIKLALVEEESGFFASSNVGKHASDVDKEGNYAYLAVSEVAEGLSIIDVSNPETPTIISNLSVEDKGRYITKSGNYVYMGVKSEPKGLAIVDITNPYSPNLILSQDIDGYGNQPAVSGNYLYMAVNKCDDENFLVYDVTQKTSPILLDSLDFDEKVYAIKLNGNYAYVGLDDDLDGFRVVNISDPQDVSQIASIDVGEEVNAIAITGSIAFAGTEDTGDSLQVIDISNPQNPTIVTSLNVSGEIQDLAIAGDYLYAAVDDVGAGLAAINISNPYSPYLAYNLDIQGKGTGIDADENYIYISTDISNRGLVIVGTTQAGVEASGTYISNYLDTGSEETRYNFIEWDHTEIPGGSVKFQIRTADSTSNLESATWVGSDGTNETFYENSRTIITLDPSRTGSRYCQFKAFLDSDGVSTPIIESVRINYNP